MTQSDAASLPLAHPPLAVAVQELNADLDTPVTAYLKAAQGETVAFLLESVEAGEKLGRYSFIGVGEQGRFAASPAWRAEQRQAGLAAKPPAPDD